MSEKDFKISKILQNLGIKFESQNFSLSSRYWTQIRPDRLIFDPYQGKQKSFRKFENFTKSRNKA